MTRKAYIRYNTICRELVQSCNVEYSNQFSHRGPRVTRTKFWFLTSSKKTATAAVSLLNDLPFVKQVKHAPAEPSKYGYVKPASITIYYKA